MRVDDSVGWRAADRSVDTGGSLTLSAESATHEAQDHVAAGFDETISQFVDEIGPVFIDEIGLHHGVQDREHASALRNIRTFSAKTSGHRAKRAHRFEGLIENIGLGRIIEREEMLDDVEAGVF